MAVRPMATPDPFKVWTKSFLPSARLNLMFMRRAWKSEKVEHDEISRQLFSLGIQTSMSYVLAEAKPMSPVHSAMTR